MPSREKITSINSDPVKSTEINALGNPAITINIALRNTCPYSTRFSVKGDELEAQVAARSDALRRNLSDYEDALAAAAVVDERGLLRFYARHRKHASAKVAAHHWLSFFRYNLDGSFGAAFLLAQVAALEGQIARALAKTATSGGGSEEEELNGLARAAGAMYLLD